VKRCQSENSAVAVGRGKGKAVMFEDDDDVRIEMARSLAEEGDSQAAEAFRAIAVDGGVDDTVRLEAAMLAQGDSRWAAAAFHAIAVDGGVDDSVRQEAARELAEIGWRSPGVP
jgi:hypothetical protein